ncbi:MAG: type II toxin-antitoxin system HicA family toxin [Microcoleus sp. PH2017_22_RUC_O_B]|uniref:type II toxin-antitoxin system HicA family toxin n=1 Tax=unclassified Microcoleus TaxID=2642155 RepID=UPI001D6F281C|nr:MULTISPECIES: type II toxin-antitoxin system HicA family toxin [unclassified Microcoleus]MCC3528849.1 type II toxin-antitoxin system HicA family toxin [Microcoleus sp. PH2017_21_RUC_O_A]MCC3541027.1 type II toxin-antitoxin system HicA family toxin [Microcoleus sp. PH2017_22_RUC_O_B]
MNSMSGKELAKLLERNDWILLRVQGSHHIYGKAGSSVRISVPIHGNKSLKVGLLRNLLKMAGLSENSHQNTSRLEESNSENKGANESDSIDEKQE